MINEISTILLLFRDCFSRGVPFNWFVIVIVGFIVRLDHHGVSSFVRWLSLDSSYYHALLAFFKASSWNLPALQRKWQQIVVSYCSPVVIDERQIIIGDGIKISKEHTTYKLKHKKTPKPGTSKQNLVGVRSLVCLRSAQKHQIDKYEQDSQN